jgi:ribosome-associated translation inhibitor RaiA
MKIQFNTDNNITGTEELRAPLEERIATSLSRFSERITRVEVHLNDENSHKNGQNDKRCMLEARLEGRQPVSVTNNDATEEQAVKGAIDKLKAALDTIIGRERNY